MKQNRWWRGGAMLVLGGLAALSVQAQESRERHVTRATMVGVGGTNVLETYLSPEKYTGTEWRLMQHITRERTDWPRWARQLVHEAHVSSTHNRADNANLLSLFYHFEYDWHRRLVDCPLGRGTFQLKVGPGVDALAGVVYSTRNGNNPAQAHGGLTGTASLVARYALPRVEKRWGWIVPVALRYEVQVPLVGVQFSPRFGQSYYEIFTQGNYDHNVVFSTPFNAPSVRQMLTADFRFSPSSALRVGYRGDIQQSKFNDLKFHAWSHLLVVGYVKSFSITQRPL